MIFAHWNNRAYAGSERIPQLFAKEVGMDATSFIEDIPEGTNKDDAIERLLRVQSVDESDSCLFRPEWPQEIERQFNDPDNDARRLKWSDLK